MRLLRGEALDAVSRESQVPAHELETWKRVFLEQDTRGLRIRGEPEERELMLARAKIGELMMRLELAEDLIEKRGFTDEWKRRAMKGRVSPGTQRPYPLDDLCGVSRAAVECVRDGSAGALSGARPQAGPKDGAQ